MKNINVPPQASSNDKAGVFSVEKVSEIARRALGKLIVENRPALPNYYEKSFFKIATEMGETELINQLVSSLPPGSAAVGLMEGLSLSINNFNQDLRQFHQSIDSYDNAISDKQQDLQQMVSPAVWKILEKSLINLLDANQAMKKQLEETETRLESQEKQVTTLQRKTRCDPLTNALNRLALEEDLSDELARGRRYKRSFGIILTDIDFFKQVNDTYGHLIGDEVLKLFVRVIRKSLREVDTVYRYGGEEFLVLLPETDLEGSIVVAERLRQHVTSQVLKNREDPSIQIRITASFGVTVFHETDQSHNNLIKRADQALYRAKASGRNRVEVGSVS